MEEAYTGFWSGDANSMGRMASINQAASRPGALILRVPQGKGHGHVVISDGEGGTVEAHSRRMGVFASTVDRRRWDTDILVPGIQYVQGSLLVRVSLPETTIYRLTDPRMTGPTVKEVYRALRKQGFDPGGIDGQFRPMTEAAGMAFQLAKGLLADGGVGPRTCRAWGINPPPAG